MATGRIDDLWHRKDRTRTTRYGKGKRWQAIWTNGQGTETKKSFDYKDGAQQWLDTQTADSMINPYGLKADQLFEDYYRDWRERQAFQRPNSLKTIDSHCTNWVVPSFTGHYLTKISTGDIQSAVNSWRAEGNAASTTKLMFRYTRQIFNEAVHDKIIRESPCVRIKFQEDEDDSEFTLSDTVVIDLLSKLDPVYKPAAEIAAATGLRPKELVGLSREDVDFPRARIKVTLQDASTKLTDVKRGPLKTKYSKRFIAFGPGVRGALLKLCKNAAPNGRLFHDEGKPVLYPKFAAEWSRVRETLPEVGTGWHQLRHYHASVLIARGMSPVAVADRLGHKDATVTLRVYAHLWVDDTAEMADIGDSILVLREQSSTEAPKVA
ncbi:tyrosine-type recombinase/integrase [Glutamicibacter ardleyensis]|uniref:tyrosine-type recombinase/integrase n=1 Tax=Glutamicibacter ardleyensis TaxID=225894 RepID=UPI003FD330FB